jgi:hypothetical protein
MKVICWNIKQFTSNKLSQPTCVAILKTILNDFDLAVILEGPHGKGTELGAQCVRDLQLIGWDSKAIDVDSVATECTNDNESVLVLHKPSIAVSNLAIWNISKVNTGRSPIKFTARGKSDAGDDKTVTRVIAAWHALSPGLNKRTGLDHDVLKAQFFKESIKSGAAMIETRKKWKESGVMSDDPEPEKAPHVLMGDFNAEMMVGSRDAYELEFGDRPTTLRKNPEYCGISGFDEAFTVEKYDRIFVKANLSVGKCGRVDVYKRTLRALNIKLGADGEPTKENEKPPRGKSWAQWVFEHYSMVSDHVPVAIEL